MFFCVLEEGNFSRFHSNPKQDLSSRIFFDTEARSELRVPKKRTHQPPSPVRAKAKQSRVDSTSLLEYLATTNSSSLE